MDNERAERDRETAADANKRAERIENLSSRKANDNGNGEPPTNVNTRKNVSDVIHQVAHLHAQGLGCNAIARELGCSPPTVGKAARQLGLNFDRRQTAAATAAVAARLGERRVVLTARLIGTAESALDNLADATDPAVARNWATVAGIAIDKVGVLHRIDNGDRVQVERNDRILTELDNEIADLANKLLEEASQRGAQVNAPILRTFIRQAESNSGGGAGVE